MNLGSHIAVAEALHPDKPRLWLGSALPDLAAIGRFRLLGATADPEIRAGIALHHRTDDVFHRSRWFTERQSRLRTELASAGIHRGAARAIAHVGPELLLDGALLQQSQLHQAVSTAFAQIKVSTGVLAPLVAGDPADFLTHLHQVADWGTPRDYHLPPAVAYRLQRILRHRPRLSFEPTEIDLVASKLEVENPGIEDSAVVFLHTVAQDLRAIPS